MQLNLNNDSKTAVDRHRLNPNMAVILSDCRIYLRICMLVQMPPRYGSQDRNRNVSENQDGGGLHYVFI